MLATLEGNEIVIRANIEDLQQTLEVVLLMNNEYESKEEIPWKVTDNYLYAKDIVTELNREDEEGTTGIHLLFDRALLEALEQGSLGVDEK